MEVLSRKMDSIICWNIKGANYLHKQKEIKKFLNLRKVGLVSVLETKVKACNMGNLYLNVFYGWCFTLNSALQKGGRIVVACNPTCFRVDILTMSSELIHCKISASNGKAEFYCTFIYAMNDAKSISEAWNDLKLISRGIKGPWLITGDFNFVMQASERIGSTVRH